MYRFELFEEEKLLNPDLVERILKDSYNDHPELETSDPLISKNHKRIIENALNDMDVCQAEATNPLQPAEISTELAQKMPVLWVLSGSGNTKEPFLDSEPNYYRHPHNEWGNANRLIKAHKIALSIAYAKSGLKKFSVAPEEIPEFLEYCGPTIFYNGYAEQCDDLVEAAKSGRFNFPPSKIVVCRNPEIQRTGDQVKEENFLTSPLLAQLQGGTLGIVSHGLHLPRIYRLMFANNLNKKGFDIKGFGVSSKPEHLENYAYHEAKGILAYTLNGSCADVSIHRRNI